jgi:DNA-binding beta-propeller fold protein YncE
MMLVLLATLAAATGVGNPGNPLPIKLVHDVALPGGASRFDYQWIDPASHRLYIAHLGADSIVVFDLATGEVAAEIKGLPSVHGVTVAPERHLVFATITGEKKLAVIDEKTLVVHARIPAGEYPNGLAYDPKSARVFVSNNNGAGIGVVDVASNRALPSIDIGGGAGNTQYDPLSGHIFAAVHKAARLVEIDPTTATVIARHRLEGVSTCHGLLVAPALRLAFAACGGPTGPTLVTFDLGKKQPVANQPLPPQVDVLAFDADLRRLYTASSTGVAAVFEVDGNGRPRKLGQGFVGPNAHSVAVDPATHRVYFPLENLDGRPVLRIMEP